MEELSHIKEWLDRKRGSWTQISKRTHLSTKTIQRIANGEVTSVSLKTYVALRDDMNEFEAAEKACKTKHNRRRDDPKETNTREVS